MYSDPELLWRDAIAKRPGNARAYNGLAVAELRNDPRRLADADTLARRAMALDSTLLTARLTVAAIAIKQARWSDAEAVLTGTLRFAPTDSATMEKLGAVLVARGEPVRAIPYLERLAEWRPSGESLTNLGAAHLSAGQLDSAIAVLERALHLEPTRVDAMGYLGGALIEQGRGGEAIPYLADAVQRDPTSGFNLGVLSVAYAQTQQADLAKQAADAAVARTPNDPGVYVFAGRAMQTAGRFHDAETYLARAVQLLPGDPQALTRLGMAEAALGNRADAARFINQALTIAPDYELARGARAELPNAGHTRR
jgi:tetratricopeptide (TPR) repeat protein